MSTSQQPLLAPSALVVFDFDSTLVREESLVTLLEYAMREEWEPSRVEEAVGKVMEITNQGIRGEIPMTESYGKRLSVATPTMKHVKKYLERPIDQIITPKMDVVSK